MNTSSTDNPIGKESIACFSQAIVYSPVDNSDIVKKTIIEEIRKVSCKTVALSSLAFVEDPSEENHQRILDRMGYCLKQTGEISEIDPSCIKSLAGSLTQPLDEIAKQTWERILQNVSFEQINTRHEELDTIHNMLRGSAGLLNIAALYDRVFHDNREPEENLQRYQSIIKILTTIARMRVSISKTSLFGNSQQDEYICDENYHEQLIDEIIDMHTCIKKIIPSYKIPSRIEVRDSF